MTEESKFLTLPTAADVAAFASRNEVRLTDRDMDRYRNALYVVQGAQRRAAVLAAKYCRPHDYKRAHEEFRAIVREARGEFEKKMLEVFSALSTRGL